MKKKILVSVVILNYNTCSLTLSLLDSIKKEGSNNLEVVLVDNNSQDGSWEAFEKLRMPNLLLIRNSENLGFAKGVNVGIKKTRGKYVLLLNSDTRLNKGSISRLVEFAEKTPDAGVVAPRLILGDGRTQKSVFRFPTIWGAIKQYWFGIDNSYGPYVPRSRGPVAVDVVVGAVFLIRREVLKKVGLFDERYFMYFEDIDYCRRVWKAGYKVYFLPQVSVIHYHGQSVKNLTDSSKQWRMLIPSSRIYNGFLRHYLINFVIWLGEKIR